VAEIGFEVVDRGSSLIGWALTQYFDELGRRFPEGFDPGEGLTDAAVMFTEPQGRFVIAFVDSRPVGCGAVQFLDAGTAELKRMWISPACRGIGLGGRLLARLEAEARQSGRRRVVLDTNGALTEAISMYRSRGYVPIPRYNENPYAHLWFEKWIEAPTAGSATA
jgi:GNAT superfamily N-acetyltransferase